MFAEKWLIVLLAAHYAIIFFLFGYIVRGWRKDRRSTVINDGESLLRGAITWACPEYRESRMK